MNCRTKGINLRRKERGRALISDGGNSPGAGTLQGFQILGAFLVKRKAQFQVDMPALAVL
jgi:hypothetical protein